MRTFRHPCAPYVTHPCAPYDTHARGLLLALHCIGEQGLEGLRARLWALDEM